MSNTLNQIHQPTGFLFIDKPSGISSHDVVNRVRRVTGQKRVGHAGTLDPFATGLLIVGVGREATREMSKLVGLDKKYEAEFVLGARSDTDDRMGKIQGTEGLGTEGLGEETIKQALQHFIGEIEQIPPTYSAVKIGGKKMYASARAGTPLIAKPRRVTIFSITDISFPSRSHPPSPSIPQSLSTSVPQSLNPSVPQSLSLTIHCSSGTYIRALARDLGEALQSGGYVQELRRTAIGPFSIQESIALDSLNKDGFQERLISIHDVLKRL